VPAIRRSTPNRWRYRPEREQHVSARPSPAPFPAPSEAMPLEDAHQRTPGPHPTPEQAREQAGSIPASRARPQFANAVAIIAFVPSDDGNGDNTPGGCVASARRGRREDRDGGKIGKDLGGKVAVITGAQQRHRRGQRAAVRRGRGAVVVELNSGVGTAPMRWSPAAERPQGDATCARRTPPRSARWRFLGGPGGIRPRPTSWSFPPASPGMVPHHDLDALDDDLIDQVLTATSAGPSRRSRVSSRYCASRETGVHRQHLVRRGAVRQPAARSSMVPRRRRSTR